MHKKPIYSFEDLTSTGVIDVPLLSIISIEDKSGMPLLDPTGNGLVEPVLIIILDKGGVASTTTIEDFIKIDTNWMWFYNGFLEKKFDEYVKIIGDTMTGALEVPAGASGTEVPQIQEVVKKTGDTMSGILNMGGKRVENIGAPNSDDDAMRRDTYATSSTGGTIKARRDGNILYMTTNGTNP